MTATGEGLGERLAARTLEIIDIPSVSGDESAALALIEGRVPGERFDLADGEDAVRCYLPRHRRPEVPLVLLAGHVDTVPIAGNVPGHRDGDTVVGRGAADMKGALAVMLEVAADPPPSDLDVGMVFFGREELPFTESALLPLFERCHSVREVALAIVLEPTANAIEVGCLGNLTVRVVFRGRAAHSARPWLGDNAIHAALQALGPIAAVGVRDVEIDGLTYREVIGVTTIEGGTGGNVVPDRVEARVNYRYAPDRRPSEAEGWLRDLLAHPKAQLEVLGNAPPGPVAVRNPLVTRLREAGDLSVGPKQAWTPVAEFAMAGIDAVNFGPGHPRYAHRDDERVDVDALVRSYQVLRAFLTGTRD